MRRTILLSGLFLLLLLLLIIGCSHPPAAEEEGDIRSDPGNPDSPIVVADTSSGTVVVAGMAHAKDAKDRPVTYSGHVQHANYLLVGPKIYIQDSGGVLSEYETTNVTIASANKKDSDGNPLAPYPVPLTSQPNWTLLINSTYKLYSRDRKAVVIDTTKMNPPFALTYMTPAGYPPYWDLPTLNTAFSTVVLSTFKGKSLYDSGSQPHPGPGQWIITFDYCKGGRCTPP